MSCGRLHAGKGRKVCVFAVEGGAAGGDDLLDRLARAEKQHPSPKQAQRRSNLGSSQCGTLLSASTTQPPSEATRRRGKGRAAPVGERHAVDGFLRRGRSGDRRRAGRAVFARARSGTVAQAHQGRAAPR